MKNKKYNQLIESFREWLVLLNYDQNTRKSGPTRVGEFLAWMELGGINSLAEIDQDMIQLFFDYLKVRPNKRTGHQGLSINYIRTYQVVLRRFGRYLRETGQGNIDVRIQIKANEIKARDILSRDEIKQLYSACDGSLLGIRDRAMLSVYYGCGLRRNEGASLLMNDVLFDKNLLHVKKGKNYKERLVPITKGVKKDLLAYVQIARPSLVKRKPQPYFFVSITGGRLRGPSMYQRCKQLMIKAEITKKAGVHTLRHSIATHLLQSGMSLYQIAKFLGHRSLESTQIYTRIADGI